MRTYSYHLNNPVNICKNTSEKGDNTQTTEDETVKKGSAHSIYHKGLIWVISVSDREYFYEWIRSKNTAEIQILFPGVEKLLRKISTCSPRIDMNYRRILPRKNLEKLKNVDFRRCQESYILGNFVICRWSSFVICRCWKSRIKKNCRKVQRIGIIWRTLILEGIRNSIFWQFRNLQVVEIDPIS